MSTILEKHKKRMIFNFLSKKYDFRKVTTMEIGDEILYTLVYNDTKRIIRLTDRDYRFTGLDEKMNKPDDITKKIYDADEEITMLFSSNMEFLIDDVTKMSKVEAFQHIAPVVVREILRYIGAISPYQFNIVEHNTKERCIKCEVYKAVICIDQFTILEDNGALIMLYSAKKSIEDEINAAAAKFVDLAMKE